MMPFVLAAVVGCSTIHSARDAQREVAAKGAEEVVAAAQDKVALGACSLPELVEFALTNRPSMISANLAVTDARLALKQIAADAPLVSETPWTAPKLSISGGHSERSPGSTMGDLDLSTEGNPSAALSLELPVWDFGRNAAAAKAQAERVTAAELALLNEGYTVFYEVASAYFGVMEKVALLEVAMTNEMEFAVHLQQAQDMADSGEGVRLDILKAKYDLAAASESRVAASNALATAEVEMMRALGLEVDGVDLASFKALGGASLARTVRGFDSTEYGADAAFALARTNSPTMKMARSRLRAASHEVDAAVADLLPSVSLSASVNWSDPLWAWNWGVSGVQSLFQGFRKTTAVDRAVVAMKEAAAGVDDAEQKLSGDIALAVADRDNALEALVTAETALSRAKENLDTVARRFEIGEASRVDYTDAVADYVLELGARVRAFYRGQLAEASLFTLLGRYPAYHKEETK